MNANALQTGQHYDAGYPVPALQVGQPIGSTGRTVIAAIRETDTPGYLPGLHTVVAYDPAGVHPYVVWSAAYQPGTGWVASSGDYFTDHAEAVTRMAQRSGRGWHPQADPGRPSVDPELFSRTAPKWNCVDYPGAGMHYAPHGDCGWCGMTREQIAAEGEAAEAERIAETYADAAADQADQEA